jgi:hypothetical protein
MINQLSIRAGVRPRPYPRHARQNNVFDLGRGGAGCTDALGAQAEASNCRIDRRRSTIGPAK